MDRWAARNLFYKEEAKHVSVLWAMLLCKALTNTAASLITGKKRNIDCERRESWGKQGDTEPKDRTKMAAVTSGLCTQIWKGQPKPPSATLACVDLQNQNKVLSGADGPAPWMSYTILSGHRKWNVSASLCVMLCVLLVWVFQPAMSEAEIQLRSDWMWFINHKGENVEFNFHTSSGGFCSRWPH